MFESSDMYQNVVRYAERNLKTFDEEALNAVDCLIFAWLIFLNYRESFEVSSSQEGLPIKEMLKAEYFEEMFDKTWSKRETFKLLVACASSPRFRDVSLKYYHNEIDENINLQFAAGVFSVSDKMNVVAFRGTDWSITGWKEDMLLALDKPAPAQLMSAKYLEDIAQKCDGEFVTCGHSKGGNLSIFSVAMADGEIQKRIKHIYSFDGPGFRNEMIESEGYKKVKDKIIKYVPQGSVVGMLFETDTELNIVYSNKTGVLQHNPLSWKVIDNDFFNEEKRGTISSKVNDKINDWIDSLSYDEIRIIIQTGFDILNDVGAESIDDFAEDPRKYFTKLYLAVKKLDPEKQEFMKNAFYTIFDKESISISMRGNLV